MGCGSAPTEEGQAWQVPPFPLAGVAAAPSQLVRGADLAVPTARHPCLLYIVADAEAVTDADADGELTVAELARGRAWLALVCTLRRVPPPSLRAPTCRLSLLLHHPTRLLQIAGLGPGALHPL